MRGVTFQNAHRATPAYYWIHGGVAHHACVQSVSQSVSSSAADAVWVATGDELKTMQCNLFNKHARFSASTP